MRNIKITIEYDGTNFHGWQKQLGLRTVQGTVEESVKKILQEDIKIIGAGRTDRSVHAEGQVANFLSNTEIKLNTILYRLNKILPEDVRIKSIKEVKKDFHSRYKVKSKLYRYTILNSSISSPLSRLYSCYIQDKLDVSKIRLAKKYIEGRHDFKAFATSGDCHRDTSKMGCVPNFIRTIEKITIQKKGKFIHMKFKAKSFLKSMVRNIVGTFIEIGRNKMKPEDVKDLLESRDRRRIPKSAPGCGLCLVKIKY